MKEKFKHPLYGKIIKRSTKVHAQNENNASIGDVVTVKECKHFLKQKQQILVNDDLTVESETWLLKLRRVNNDTSKSLLKITDNSGARSVMCIKVASGFKKKI